MRLRERLARAADDEVASLWVGDGQYEHRRVDDLDIREVGRATEAIAQVLRGSARATRRVDGP